MSRMRTRPGLTLVELLAAAVILSAMAAAAVSVQRDAATAAASARQRNQALDVLELWRSISVDQQSDWHWNDAQNAAWRVRIEPDSNGSPEPRRDAGDLESLPWESVIVERRDATVGDFIEALRLYRPAPPRLEAAPPEGWR